MYSEVAQIPSWVLIIAHSILAISMILSALRIWIGPTTPDRIVALDLMAALIMGQFVLLVFSSGFLSYLDVAAAIAIISFLATVAFARYLEIKNVEKS